MKWTENGITFEGTADEYMTIYGKRQKRFAHRRGLDYTVFDRAGKSHGFVRQKDAAAFIAQQLGIKFSPNKLSVMKTRCINIADLIPDSELDLIIKPDTATPQE